jgi:hypothetical protein
MTELRLRREALVLESELNRQALRVELMRIEMSFDRVRQGIISGHNLWKWIAPLAGLLMARKFGRAGGMGNMAKGSALFAAGQSLWTWWRNRKNASPSGR